MLGSRLGITFINETQSNAAMTAAAFLGDETAGDFLPITRGDLTAVFWRAPIVYEASVHPDFPVPVTGRGFQGYSPAVIAPRLILIEGVQFALPPMPAVTPPGPPGPASFPSVSTDVTFVQLATVVITD